MQLLKHLTFFILIFPQYTYANVVDSPSLNTATHLGDGVHSEHFFFILDFLRDNPGSANEAKQTFTSEKKAKATKGIAKSPSASIVESEFSHLLGVVSESKQQIGVAIFNTFGLKVGMSGKQVDSLLLSSKRRARLVNLNPAKMLRIKLSCKETKMLNLSCNNNYWSIYRVVNDHATNKALGFSWLLATRLE